MGLWWKHARPQQADHHPRPVHARRAATCFGSPPTPTCSSRTSGPGTLERWDLGCDGLREANPRLVLARVTGFGQFGPYAQPPGFGTLAEAMSGFAAITGEPDGPPTLPPFGLADGIAALATAYAVMTALPPATAPARGQVVDLAIIEPILTVLGPQPLCYDQLGDVQPRTGNRSVNNAPRNTYRTADGHWVAVSTSRAVHRRTGDAPGRPPRGHRRAVVRHRRRAGRARRRARRGRRRLDRRATRDEVLAAFEQARGRGRPGLRRRATC